MAYVEMRSATVRFLMRRGPAFYYRRDIPKPLQSFLGRSAWWIKLPDDEVAAHREARVLRAAHDQLVRRLRSAEVRALVKEQGSGKALHDELVLLHMDRMAMLETEAQPQGWRTHWRREGAAQDLAEVDMVADRIHEQTAKFAPVLDATADKPRLPALSEVADDWNRRTAPSKGTLKIRATILRRIREVLGDPALAQVTRQMVRDFIGQIERLPSVTGLPAKLRNASVPALLDWADKHPEHPRVYPITVRNHAMILRSLLSWAVKEDIIPSNPALNIGLAKDERDRERDQHHAAVPWNAMPAFMAKLRATPGTTARALEFTILTAARTEQTLGMQWSELDVPGRLWTVPKGRMKGGLKEHRVFLSQVAVDVLPDQAGAHVFKRSKGDRPLPDNALRKLLETIAPGVTVHGFRSSFRDWVAEATTHDAAAAELALAHTVGTAVELAYRRGDMLAKRAKLMQDWAEFCAGG